MANTTLRIVCETVPGENDSTAFEVNGFIVAQGDLPGDGTFVYRILDEAVPKVDEFIHVASVTELTSLPRTRQDAIDAGETIYSSNSVIQVYDNITAAVEAKAYLRSLIDTLVREYDEQAANFVGGDSTHPSASPEAVDAAEQLVVEKTAALAQAEVDLAAKEAERDDKLDCVSTLDDQLLECEARLDATNEQLAYAQDAQSRHTTYKSTLSGLPLPADLSDPTDQTTYTNATANAALVDAAHSLLISSLQDTRTYFDNKCNAPVTGLRDQRDTCQAEAADLETEVLQLEAARDQAAVELQAAQDALDDLTSCCP